METKKIGIIKENASILFSMDVYNKFGYEIPDSQTKFEKVIKTLQGKIFSVEKEYGNKVFLKYPKSMIFKTKECKEITGIELFKDLVDIYTIGELQK